MIPPLVFNLPVGKKVYFASDFHLGVPNKQASLLREKKIIEWLESIEKDAELIILAGDIFDFWFEYKYTVPKGFTRILGKLANLTDRGLKIIAFTGNHDMWMFDYLEEELNIPVYRTPQIFIINNKRFLVGHGDGLGPGDKFYKVLKKIFRNRLCIKLFGFIHPDFGMYIANSWSRKSRISQLNKEVYHGEQEWLLQYCKQVEQTEHFDYYIFGHRHLPLDIKVSDKSRYINLGEWINFYTYAVFDGSEVNLLTYDQCKIEKNTI
ncbi:MAG TPA: UDP-2,3-diacylglucosamine diphosphatase [Cytophagales bacterium]|nr:UDP-2,3-diacylglucosamine diphosphatase [Cytophagales bacterium]